MGFFSGPEQRFAPAIKQPMRPIGCDGELLVREDFTSGHCRSWGKLACSQCGQEREIISKKSVADTSLMLDEMCKDGMKADGRFI